MLDDKEWDTIKDLEGDLEVLEWLYRHGHGPGTAAVALEEWKERIAKDKEELKEKIKDIIKPKPVLTIPKPPKVTPPKKTFGSWTPRKGK